MTKLISNWRRWLSLSIVLCTVLVLLVIGYSWSRTRSWLSGPVLTITSPLPLDSLPEPLVTIEGEVKRVDHLWLNDGKIFADTSGHFREQLLLFPGYNIIKLEASDRFGRRVARFLELAYQADNI